MSLGGGGQRSAQSILGSILDFGVGRFLDVEFHNGQVGYADL